MINEKKIACRSGHHFAGLNTRFFAEALEGRQVLISYADVVRRPKIWEEDILPRLRSKKYASVILDSGAFTELSTPGFSVDVEEYAAFYLEHEDLFDLVVNLDDIRGDVERSEANLEYLESRGVPAIPVFHQGEPWEVLDRMVATHSYVGVGFGRPIRGAREFLDEFFARLEGTDVKVHGFGMSRWLLDAGYPFYTTDSTTWVAEYCAVRRQEYESTFSGKHGVGRSFSLWLADDDRRELLEYVLRSYDLSEFSPEEEAEYADPRIDGYFAAMLDGTKGQAKTALRRFGSSLLLVGLFDNVIR